MKNQVNIQKYAKIFSYKRGNSPPLKSMNWKLCGKNFRFNNGNKLIKFFRKYRRKLIYFLFLWFDSRNDLMKSSTSFSFPFYPQKPHARSFHDEHRKKTNKNIFDSLWSLANKKKRLKLYFFQFVKILCSIDFALALFHSLTRFSILYNKYIHFSSVGWVVES